jgi:hypothetical protein
MPTLAWSEELRSIPFRAGLALAGTVIPPLGIIGWASPIIAAGILFPGFGIAGLLLCFALSGVAVPWPRPTIAVAALAITAAHLTANARATPRAVGWQGIDMRFGDVGSSPIKQFEAATEIQEIARASTADVIVFHELTLAIPNQPCMDITKAVLAGRRISGKLPLIPFTRLKPPNSLPNQSVATCRHANESRRFGPECPAGVLNAAGAWVAPPVGTA